MVYHKPHQSDGNILTKYLTKAVKNNVKNVKNSTKLLEKGLKQAIK